MPGSNRMRLGNVQQGTLFSHGNDALEHRGVKRARERTTAISIVDPGNAGLEAFHAWKREPHRITCVQPGYRFGAKAGQRYIDQVNCKLLGRAIA